MPKRVPSAEVAIPSPTGLIAAATRLAGPGVKKKDKLKPINAEAWQSALWMYYDTISELRFSANWVGNLLSRAKLEVRYDGEVVETGVGWDALQLFYGGPDKQPEFFRSWGIHATVAGECYLVGEDGGQSRQDRWFTVAATEMARQGDVWKRDGQELDDPLVVRLWKPHPRRRKEADSPARAILPILSELDWLTKAVAATLSSRASGRGILAIPSEVNFAGGPVTTAMDGTSTSPSANAVLLQLMETMMAALEDPESPAAAVPLLFQGPAEYLDKIQHILLESGLEEMSVALREEAIRRIGIGMDMPPEVLTGQGDMNHWNSWRADEDSIKIHTEPLLAILTASLTEGYLRPYVIGATRDEDEAERWTFTADTSGMRNRPNRSKEAIELFQMGALSEAAMLRENGFSEDDAPSEAERKLWHVRKLAGGTTTPEAVQAAYALLGIDLPIELTERLDAGDPERPNTSIADHPVQELPDSADDVGLAASVAAAEVMVYRVLERAGNRMKPRHAQFPMGVTAPDYYLHRRPRDAAELDAIMEGCWGFVERFDYGIPHDRFVAALDAYTRGLLRTGRPYRRAELRKFIAAVREREGSPRTLAAKMAIERVG